MKTALMAAILALSLGPSPAAETPTPPRSSAPLPVILDTDIGTDLDDTWALVMLLKSPQFDVKLITTTDGKARFRAGQIARILTAARRTDIPIGLGEGRTDTNSSASLTNYPGTVCQDGAGAIIKLLAKSPAPMTVISIGPLDTLAAVVDRRPDVVRNADFVGMQGSIHSGYGGGPPSAEWNVRANIPAAQKVFAASWRHMTLTPLDTCGRVILSGARFQAVKDSRDPRAQIIIETYRAAAEKATVAELTASTVLFDTVAVYLADPGPKPFLKLETLPIVVTDDGFTRVNANGHLIQVATAWEDLDGYYDLLVRTLVGP